MTAGKGDGQVFRRNLSDIVCIGLIKAGISVHFVKIIDTQMIFRRFIFDNVMSAKDLSDFLLYGNTFTDGTKCPCKDKINVSFSGCHCNENFVRIRWN